MGAINYWLSLLVGVLVVVYLYRARNTHARSHENFGTIVSGCEKGPSDTHRELSTDINAYDNVRFYITSLSDYVGSGEDSTGLAKSYCAASSKWMNYKNIDEYFTLTSSATVPTTLRTGTQANGLPLLNVRLMGPQSDAFARPNMNYILKPFSLIYYMKINSLAGLSKEVPIVLWRMAAENPNHVELRMRQHPDDAAKVYVELVLGTATLAYRWAIPKTTILAGGNNAVYALSYDAGDAFFYIGGTRYPVSMTNVPTIKLGNTPVEINSNQNFDAIMYAFIWYDKAVTSADIVALNDYFSMAVTGTLLQLQQITTQSDTEIQRLTDTVSQSSVKVNDLEQKLSECKTQIEAVSSAKKEEALSKWKVQLTDNMKREVSKKDLEQCSPAWIKNWGASAVQAGADAAAGATASVTSRASVTSALPLKYQVKYPGTSGLAVPRAPTASGGSSGSTSTTTTSSTAATPASNDSEFWKGFFDMVNKAKVEDNTETTTTTATTGKTAYEMLRDSTFDKTLPGPGEDLVDEKKTSASEATTKDTVAATPANAGFWDRVKTFFGAA